MDGRRLGAYVVGEWFADIPEDEGRLYAAHHVETGAPALVLIALSQGDESGPAETVWTCPFNQTVNPRERAR